MIGVIATAAFVAGMLVSLSRSVNGRLSLSTSPLVASFWNHLVGFVFLIAVAAALGGALPGGVGALSDAPAWAWAGGPAGVLFVALGSVLVARIGAAPTAMLVIAGQMVSGVVLDLWRGSEAALFMQASGVCLIVAGMWLMQRRAG